MPPPSTANGPVPGRVGPPGTSRLARVVMADGGEDGDEAPASVVVVADAEQGCQRPDHDQPSPGLVGAAGDCPAWAERAALVDHNQSCFPVLRYGRVDKELTAGQIALLCTMEFVTSSDATTTASAVAGCPARCARTNWRTTPTWPGLAPNTRADPSPAKGGNGRGLPAPGMLRARSE